MSISTPLENIKILQSQIYNIIKKYKILEEQLHDYHDKDLSFKNVEEIEKIENELNFLNRYHKNLEDQLVVIMNEHNIILPTE
jgi:predicted  nucleic acid-binding Zn-ribbon protein